jgi:DNA polymerase III epsilon subunit-like protein
VAAPPEGGWAPLSLRDRAYAFLKEHGSAPDDALLRHVYGGTAPPGLRRRLATPLESDPRLERRADGTWTLVGAPRPGPAARLKDMELSALALLATGPTPGRGRVVHLSALHVQRGAVVERFSASVNPGVKRVPRYVASRLGVAAEVLDDLPPFAALLDDLMHFLGTRPLLAQDAQLAWEFVQAEARRVDTILPDRVVLDANQIATHLLRLNRKPSLALVAAHLGIGTIDIARPDEEARVLAEVASRLLALAEDQGCSSLDDVLDFAAHAGATVLRRGRTARALQDEPGVYVLRDRRQVPLYVGKARKLRARLAAYVHRPLGPTRRLEGLVDAVEAVDPMPCATDLEALILEDREIHRLQPRFNTVRRQHTPRLWIRLPPLPPPRGGRRQLAARRLESSRGPGTAPGEFIGPFRNETAAEQARSLARDVFQLDVLRKGDPTVYEARLQLAWAFLHGDTQAAEALARQRSPRLVHRVLAFQPGLLLLPADPSQARYAVVRPGASGIEGLLIDRGQFRGYALLVHDDLRQFALELLTIGEARSRPEDCAVVVRWIGAQRPPACLVHLPDDARAAADAIESAAALLLGNPGET